MTKLPKTPVHAKPSSTELKLLDAAKVGDLPTVSRLLEAGTAVDARDNRGAPWNVTPLMHAARAGFLPIVRLLLGRGASVRATDQHLPGDGGGRTALHYAVEGKHLLVAEELVRAGADVNAQSAEGTPLLDVFTRPQGKVRTVSDVRRLTAPPEGDELKRMLGILNFLLAKGADPNVPNPATGGCPLDRAASSGAKELAKALLEAGANPNHQDHQGTTAFSSAASKRHVQVGKLLLEARLDVKLKDHDGTTPLMWAVLGGEPRLVSMLVDAGAPVNELNSDHKTALDLACEGENSEMIRILVKAGAKRATETGTVGTAGKKRR